MNQKYLMSHVTTNLKGRYSIFLFIYFLSSSDMKIFLTESVFYYSNTQTRAARL